MKLNNILLSTKKTALEYYKEQSDSFENDLPPEELRNTRERHAAHYKSLNQIKDILKKHNISFDKVYTPYAEYDDFKDRDLIISVGGDGTVLNSAHYVIDKTPILTVRSERQSKGALCNVDTDNFETALERILKDEFFIEEWTRAEGKLSQQRVLALNEIYAGLLYAFKGAARYELSFKDKIETQMSSGIVISTGAGSTAWYKNIGHVNFPRTAGELRFCVRDYYVDGNYKLKEGVIKEDETLKIKSKMNIDGCVCFDGNNEKLLFPFKAGETLEVRVAEKPLDVINFKQKLLY